MKLKRLLKNKFNGIGLVFLLTVVIRIAVSFAAGYVQQQIPGLSDGLLTTIGQVCYALPGIVFLLLNRQEIKEIMHIRKLRIPSILLLFVIGVLMVPVMAFINGISLLFTENAASPVMQSFVADNSWLYVISIMALVPAFFEEMIYRGVFFGTLRRAGLAVSILVSGLLFGLLHMNMNQLCYAFVMGILMAMIVEITGSLFSTMIIHFTINGTTVSLTYLLSRLSPSTSQAASTASLPTGGILFALVFYGIISVFALAGIIALLYVICIAEGRTAVFQGINPFCKTITREKNEAELGNASKNVFSIPMILGILVCVVLIGIIFVKQG